MTPIDVALGKKLYPQLPPASLKIYFQRLSRRWHQDSTYVAGLILFVRMLEPPTAALATIERYKKSFDRYLQENSSDLTDLVQFTKNLRNNPPLRSSSPASEVFVEW